MLGNINSNKTNKGSEWENRVRRRKPNKLSQLLRLSRPAYPELKSSIRAEVVELVDTLPEVVVPNRAYGFKSRPRYQIQKDAEKRLFSFWSWSEEWLSVSVSRPVVLLVAGTLKRWCRMP